MLRDLMGKFAQGALKPPPVTTFAAEQVIPAFRSMQKARHTGKIVLTWDLEAVFHLQK